MITIFTPTYNRKEKLIRLYHSLVYQTNKNFEWIIVDDGSTDNTKIEIEKMKKEGKIKITAIYQKNYGKHVAMNKAFDVNKNRFFMCVDSDDYLSKDAIQILTKLANKFNRNIWAIVGPRVHENGSLETSWNIQNVKEIKFADIYNKYKYKGETYILIDIYKINHFRFPYFNSEILCPENILYDYMDRKYNIISVKNKIYISDYQVDGYTKNVQKIYRICPYGMAISNLSQSSNYYYSLKKRMIAYARHMAIIKVFSLDIRKLNFQYEIKWYVKMLSVFIFPILFIHNKRKIKEQKEDEK